MNILFKDSFLIRIKQGLLLCLIAKSVKWLFNVAAFITQTNALQSEGHTQMVRYTTFNSTINTLPDLLIIYLYYKTYQNTQKLLVLKTEENSDQLLRSLGTLFLAMGVVYLSLVVFNKLLSPFFYMYFQTL